MCVYVGNMYDVTMHATSPQIKKGSVVEIFLIDEGKLYDISHPVHLHGMSFSVVAMERHATNPTYFFGTSAGTLSSLYILST